MSSPISLVFALLIGCCLALPAFADKSFTTELYPVDPGLFAAIDTGVDPFAAGVGDPFGGGGGGDPFADSQPAGQGDDAVQEFFGSLIDLPPKSRIQYLPRLGKISVHTSPAAHEQFGKLLDEIFHGPIMVSIDYTLISLPSNEVMKSEVYRETGSLSNEEVMRLFRAGHAKLLSLCKVTTLSGVNAQVEGVDEIIYPTEFEFEKSGGSASNSPPAVLTPGAFETRETGHIFNVTPTIAPDNKTIHLAIIPEKAELVGWIDYSAPGQDNVDEERKSRMSQPIFRSQNITTSIVVIDGQPAVIGGAPHPETGAPCFSIITARIIEVKAKEAK